jgi:catechol 2,3-dioxygenase-like lactoylglutathione lyase family enzyme
MPGPGVIARSKAAARNSGNLCGSSMDTSLKEMKQRSNEVMRRKANGKRIHRRGHRVRRESEEIEEIGMRRTTMLTTGKMVGFLLTKDYGKAREFYEAKLGFTFVALNQFALVMRAGVNLVRIVEAAQFTPLRSTVLGWEVGDVEAEVGWLAGQGVETEKYPWVADKERGIWTTPGGDKVAWFKDPDGNVLSVSQHR